MPYQGVDDAGSDANQKMIASEQQSRFVPVVS